MMSKMLLSETHFVFGEMLVVSGGEGEVYTETDGELRTIFGCISIWGPSPAPS